VLTEMAIPPDQVRTLLVAETELGDRILSALMTRRATMVEMGTVPRSAFSSAIRRRSVTRDLDLSKRRQFRRLRQKLFFGYRVRN
jgi:hypothetical protein